MRIPEHIRDRFQPLDRACFKKIKDKEFRPSYDLTSMKYLRDKARNERDMRELYRGRAPYELLQNADDAGATRVAFILSRDGLAFVHDGIWFTVDNFRSLADGWSDKDPNECIGHKGLGFRSVLDITPAPYLVQVGTEGFFAVKFTWALNNGHIQETFRRDQSLRQYYDDWTKHGQQACPIMAIPGLAKKRNLGVGASIFDKVSRGQYGDQFTTMFWFPAKDPETDRRVLSELSPMPIIADGYGQQTLVDFLKDEVSVLLPFLASVERVAVYKHDRRIGLARLSRAGDQQKPGQVTVHTEINGQAHSGSFFQMPFAFRIPPQIHYQQDTPRAIKAMKEAKVVLSAKLEKDQPVQDSQARFHVYFPTGEDTGLGFVVHGDFYVKPDRTRLMSSSYNEWLLGEIAKVAANEFLTQLLKQYQPRSVFEALSPAEHQATEAAKTLVSLFSRELHKRNTPFVPTGSGLLTRVEALLPPRIDKDGFWETHFSDVVPDVVEGKKALLAHKADGEQTRAFLNLAGVQTLDHEAILTFIETASQQTKPPSWWYECYTYMAIDRKLSRQGPSFFAGHKLIPTTDSTVIVVPDDSSLVVCLPPAGKTSTLHVPDLFSLVFVFLDFEVARLVEKGEDIVRSWVLDRFRVSRFEATDLLPRAIRGVGPQLFSGELSVTAAELRQAWLFIKDVIDLSRTPIVSPSFWQDLGRFPLPLDTALSDEGYLSPESLVPAFLAYWPDSFAEGERSLAGIEGLRRIDEKFLHELIEESRKSGRDWVEFFQRIGVSAIPKVLTYGRLVARAEDLPFVSGAPGEFEVQGFSGERQSDENRAIIWTLGEEDLWETQVDSVALCNHPVPKVLQSLTALEGINHCAQAAQREYQYGDDNWHQRLWALVRELRLSLTELEEDKVFCRGGGRGGHSTTIGSYLQRQLDYYGWLPSSQGPASSCKCFVRLSSRRLISSGRSDEELGDLLFPYVVVNSVDDLAKLQRLGVKELEDAASASSPALIRALTLLGERLSTEWGQKEILEVRSRWRLVRGAIQEIYRSLNQRKEILEYPPDIKFATRSDLGVEFRSDPLYYAEPGSTIEQAFLGTLPLLDADRPYPQFFEQIGVTRLVPGETVDEKFLAEANSVPASRLQEEIVEKLSPHLLAPIIAKSDRPDQRETILRRLRERFEVKAADHLTVSYSLVADPTVEQTIEFPKFYLQRRITPGPGAIQEAYYTLYVASKASVSFSGPDLDADALGAALVPVFLDGMSEELAGLFPRIASRYYHRRGDAEEMQEFMHRQLGISQEAQELANAMISGEAPEARPVPPPPPVKIIYGDDTDVETSVGDRQNLKEKMQVHQDEISEKTHDLISTLIDPFEEKTPRQTDSVPAVPPAKPDRITPEQEERGERGEEEIKRRLEQFGNWVGFRLISDTRKEGCGYDFLCDLEGREVKLEVKTFTPNGRIFVTSTELQVAASSKDDYYLVGVLDDGRPEYDWRTFIIQNPASILLTEGEFDIQATLKASATKVFDLDREE